MGMTNGRAARQMEQQLVSRIRSSLYFAARSGANFGFDKDTSKVMILVWFMVQKFARWTRGKRWSELLNHHISAGGYSGLSSASM
jgi:hypothetical protein